MYFLLSDISDPVWDDFYSKSLRGAKVAHVFREDLAIVKSDSLFLYVIYDRRVKEGDTVTIQCCYGSSQIWYIKQKESKNGR